MADPIPLKKAEIPFAESAPSDDLIIEDLGNDEVLIGDPILDDADALSGDFDSNIAEQLDERLLNKKADSLVRYYDNDKAARSEWEQRYKEGLKTLDPDGGLEESEEDRASRGLSIIVHPMMAEAATQFNAKAIAELYPSSGPVKTTIIGDPNEELEEQARRVRDFMNYQITQEMSNYFTDLDQMLFQLPLIGHAFKKIWWDANLEKQCSEFVRAEDFVVSPESIDIKTSNRFSHVIRMSRNEYNKYVAAGWYMPIEYTGTSIDPSGDYISEIDGVDQEASDENDQMVTLLEMHVYDMFDGIDGFPEETEEQNDNVVMLPYIITVDYDSEKIVSIKRNWEEKDPKKERREWFVSYKFLPGIGFYGFGLYHMIGGLGKAATGALRALLDSAAFANMQGGFKLKGRVSGGEIDVSPGEFVDLDATVDDVNKAIMPLPFKEPSGTLFNLLGFITDAGQRFASTADLNVGDVNPNAPVGSTVALIEQGSKAFSAIHKRLHHSQGREFKLLAKLNQIYLPESMPFALSGASQTIFAKDFNDRIDIIPVSDPNIFSTAQRIAQAQAVLDMARSAPQLHDLYEAYKRMYEAIRIPAIDEVLKKPEKAVRLDPIDENLSVMYGKPIKAFPEQDHESHIAVHMQFLSDPSLGGNPGAKGLRPILIAHIAEHIALLYRTRMEASLAMPLRPLPDIRDPKFKMEDIDPQLDMLISQRAAQVVQNAPQMQPIKSIQVQQNPLQYAQQLAKLEQDSLIGRTESQIKADQMRAESDIQIDRAKAQQDLDEKALKLQADLEAKVRKLEADIAIEREKNLQGR